MSLFEGLNVATRGLSAAQLAINVTGQNITNAGTEGYSRKRVEQSAEWRKDGSFGQMGFGVEVYSINRVRDQFIDRLVNEEWTRYGYYSMKDASYDRLENIFHEALDPTKDKSYGLNSLLNDFWNGWSDVANNPESAGARETLRSTTQTLVGQFHYLATQLRSYKDTINDEIEARAIKINQITAGIYHCNTIISASENTIGNKANDTRDQRDELLEELAKLIDVDYIEDENGILNVSCNGQILVSNAKNHELTIRRTEVTGYDGYQYSRVDVALDLTGKAFTPKNGEFKALIEIRDVDIPQYEEYINEVAKTLVTEVNKIHQSGYALSGLTFMDFFDSDPSKLTAANISLSQAVKDDINNIAAGKGGKVTTQPPTDFRDQLNFNDPNKPVLNLRDIPIRDAYGNIYSDNHYGGLCKGTLVIEGGNPPRTLIEGLDYYVDYKSAQIIFHDTNGDLFVDNTNPLNPLNFPVFLTFDYNENGYAGPGDGENALMLSQLRNKALMQGDIFGKSTQTINEYYTSMLGRLGTERNDAAVGLGNRTNAMVQLKTRQDEIMGVDIDEELANLIQFQHTYQASARYLTTINTMLDTLLNM